jgi:preprotein translocase subunit SecG
MLIVFGILVILASVILGLIVLIQNPKGGGLSSSFGGFGNQIMGVKQTTDVLEKGTWLFAAIVAILCITSPAFIPKGNNNNSESKDLIEGVSTKTPANATPVNTATPVQKAPDSVAK